MLDGPIRFREGRGGVSVVILTIGVHLICRSNPRELMLFDATLLLIGPGGAVADSDTRAVADSGQRLLGLGGQTSPKPPQSPNLLALIGNRVYES